MTDFLAHTGHSLDMGSFPFSAASGDLDDTYALLRVGTISALRVLLSSQSPPANSVVDWTPSTGLLRIDLSEDVIDSIGVGRFVYQISIVRSSGRKLYALSGGFQVVRSLPEEIAA